MCGIAGILSPHDGLSFQDVVEEITNSQHFRGPDYKTVQVIDGPRADACLGHNRLSIIDLSDHARQPMWDSTHTLVIVYNGEIYNYREIKAELRSLGHVFSTKSDTEVILEAFREWGPEAVHHLNGMFAFALIDTAEGRLHLYRDRFGVKPLYYYEGQDFVVFASTTRVIGKRFGLQPNLQYAASGLRYGFFDHADSSPFRGVKAVKPGQHVWFEFSTASKITCNSEIYYDINERIAESAESLAKLPEPVLLDKLEFLLKDAVDLRFRADVPVGVSLSGGIDSSILAAIAAEKGYGNVDGFTFGSPGDASTEGAMAGDVAQKCGTRIHFINPSVKEIVQAFDRCLSAQECPFGSGSVVAQHFIFEEARKRGILVLLGGQGGDEVFMGYRKFMIFQFQQILAQKKYRETWKYLASLVPTIWAESTQMAVYRREMHRYSRSNNCDSVLIFPEAPQMDLGANVNGPLWKRQVVDVLTTSLPTLLRYEDRNSMGNSVESRLPYLDYRIVEYGLALPTSVKLRHGYGKWALRQVARGRIPEQIRAARKKRGFDVREAFWIRNGLGQHLRELIRDRFSAIRPWIAPGLNVDRAFSDDQLVRRPTAFMEAVILVWLGNTI